MDVDDSEDDESEPKKTTAATSGKKKTASETYQQLTPIEHILKRPDSYIGSVETLNEKLWVFDSETKRMVFRCVGRCMLFVQPAHVGGYRDVSYVPGFFKIVDEILVNAADNKACRVPL